MKNVSRFQQSSLIIISHVYVKLLEDFNMIEKKLLDCKRAQQGHISTHWVSDPGGGIRGSFHGQPQMGGAAIVAELLKTLWGYFKGTLGFLWLVLVLKILIPCKKLNPRS